MRSPFCLHDTECCGPKGTPPQDTAKAPEGIRADSPVHLGEDQVVPSRQDVVTVPLPAISVQPAIPIQSRESSPQRNMLTNYACHLDDMLSEENSRLKGDLSKLVESNDALLAQVRRLEEANQRLVAENRKLQAEGCGSPETSCVLAEAADAGRDAGSGGSVGPGPEPAAETGGPTILADMVPDTVEPAVSDEELRSLILGDNSSKLENVEWNIANEDRLGEFSWTLAMALRNPCKVIQKGISMRRADDLFNRCFKGEEISRSGSHQRDRFYTEKETYLQAFDALPKAGSHGEKAFGGGSEPGDSSFLELVRKTLIVKLELHSGLHVRSILSEDEDHVLVTVTCTANEVLREAELGRFRAELNLRIVDPASLEPCTTTYYPLLHWFFRYQPVEPDDALITAYKDLLAMLREASEEDRLRYSAEVAFWMEVEHDVARIVERGQPSRASKRVEEPKLDHSVSWIPVHGSLYMEFCDKAHKTLQFADIAPGNCSIQVFTLVARSASPRRVRSSGDTCS